MEEILELMMSFTAAGLQERFVKIVSYHTGYRLLSEVRSRLGRWLDHYIAVH
jgi:hypothetical protein